MMCPKCGAKTKVTSSRSIAKPGKGWAIKRAKGVVGWYTHDFIVRRRNCTKCDFADLTAELLLDDIKGIVRETMNGHAPESITKREKKNESSDHYRESRAEARGS